MRLNKSTRDALQILIECARAEGELVKVADLSARLGITMQNVFKIVHILSRAELVAAVRGRYGGVRLARTAAQIRIGDAVRAMEETEFAAGGVTANEAGGRRGAGAVHQVLDDAMLAFIGVLDQHTLADMAGATSLEDKTSRNAPLPRRRAGEVGGTPRPSRAAADASSRSKGR